MYTYTAMSLVVALSLGGPFIKMRNCKILLQYFIYTHIKPHVFVLKLRVPWAPAIVREINVHPLVLTDAWGTRTRAMYRKLAVAALCIRSCNIL